MTKELAPRLSILPPAQLRLWGHLADVVQKRAVARDYLDIAALIGQGIDLQTVLAAGQAIYGRSFNPKITLKALSYFEDGDLDTLPAAVRQTLQQAVSAVDLNALPRLSASVAPKERGCEAMKPLELTNDLRNAAKRCVWYEPPEKAVLEPAKLVAHILTFGGLDDVNALRAQYSNDDIERALDSAPAGVYDARSWAYWNLVVGRYKTPPMPARHLP